MSRTLDELTTYDITELISLFNAYDVWYRVYSAKLQAQDKQEKQCVLNREIQKGKMSDMMNPSRL